MAVGYTLSLSRCLLALLVAMPPSPIISHQQHHHHRRDQKLNYRQYASDSVWPRMVNVNMREDDQEEEEYSSIWKAKSAAAGGEKNKIN